MRVAPFQLLASEGAVYHERPHLRHLGLANRLAAAAPEFLATTRRVEVETGDPASVAAAPRGGGLEALDRVARGEPLWRVHECVFAVLALESEPVDPRL